MKKTSIVTILVAFGALSATPIGSSAATVWDPEQQLTAGAYDEYTDAAGQRNVVVDPQGRIHVVWYVEDYLLPNPFQIYYKRYNPGSGWTQDTCLTPDLMARNIYNRYPSITVDAQGNLHLVWCAGLTTRALSTIYYKRCTPSGSGNGGWQDTAQSIGPGWARIRSIHRISPARRTGTCMWFGAARTPPFWEFGTGSPMTAVIPG